MPVLLLRVFRGGLPPTETDYRTDNSRHIVPLLQEICTRDEQIIILERLKDREFERITDNQGYHHTSQYAAGRDSCNFWTDPLLLRRWPTDEFGRYRKREVLKDRLLHYYYFDVLGDQVELRDKVQFWNIRFSFGMIFEHPTSSVDPVFENVPAILKNRGWVGMWGRREGGGVGDSGSIGAVCRGCSASGQTGLSSVRKAAALPGSYVFLCSDPQGSPEPDRRKGSRSRTAPQ